MVRRFRVVEDSMRPTLEPGDMLLAVRDPSPPVDSVVVFPHPDRDGMWLVKRVSIASGGEAWVESDNPSVTRADSRTFGYVGTQRMHRVVLRLRPPLRVERL